MSIPTGHNTYKTSVEWYTPARYINLVRKVLGGIDLDPASCEIANSIVQATTFYTFEQNGLHLPWFGRVFLNPPYGKTGNDSHQEKFTGRLIHEYRAGHVKSAICLTSATDTSTTWYHRLMDYPHCITDHRIKFWYYAEGYFKNHDRSMGGSLFTYFGDNQRLFFNVFEEIGSCMYPRRARKYHELWDEN